MIHNSMIQRSGLKVNGAETVEVLSGEAIQIGDIVYSLNVDVDTSIDWGIISTLYVIEFSPDGNFLAIGGERGVLKIFSVNGTELTYLRDISVGYIGSTIYTALFFFDHTNNKTVFMIGGDFSDVVKTYSVTGNTFTEDTTILSTQKPEGECHKIMQLPNAEILISGGVQSMAGWNGYAKTYSFNGTAFSYGADLDSDGDNTAFDDIVYSSVVSSDDKWVVLGGRFTGRAKIYTLEKAETGNTITYYDDLYNDASDAAIPQYAAEGLAFSPDSSILIVGTGYPASMGVSGRLNVYTIGETGATFRENLTNVTGFVNAIEFSPDGKSIFVGGYFDGGVNVYSVLENKSIAFSKTIYGSTEYNIRAVSFNQDGTLLFVGGNIPDVSDVYFVNGTDFSIAMETVYPITGNYYTVENEYTYISIGKSNVGKGEKVKVSRILKLSSPSVTELSLVKPIIEEVADGTSNDG